MKKCLKVTFISKTLDRGIRDAIQTVARELHLEGTIQFVGAQEMVIIACGSKEDIDRFLDNIHQGFGANIPEDIQVEPFLKEKDYRGIFRILE